MNTTEIAELLFEIFKLSASKEKGTALPDRDARYVEGWKDGAAEAEFDTKKKVARAILEHFSDHGITCLDDINRGMSYTNASHLLVSIFEECKAIE